MNTISLLNTTISATPIKLFNALISYGWNNKISTDPIPGSFANVEAQFNGWENPQINLTFYIPIDNTPSGYMTWNTWHQFVKSQYLGTSATTTYLYATLGSNDTPLASYAASSLASSTYPIPIIIKSYNMNVSADESNGTLWVINAQLTETK